MPFDLHDVFFRAGSLTDFWARRKNSDPFGSLIIANRNSTWRTSMEENIKILRSKNTSIQEIVRIKQDYLDSMMKNLESMIVSGVFRSNTVSQMLQITKLMDFNSVCRTSPHSIHRIIMEKSGKIPTVRRFDPFYRAWDAFAKLMEETNKFFLLNSGNLCGMVELLIAQLFFKFAHTNKTWTFFYCTVIFESGNGHFSTNTPDGPLPNRGKINNVGADFTNERANDVHGAMYDVLFIAKKDRYHEFLTTMRTTPTVMENITCATLVGGKIVSIPQAETNFQVISMTENREDQGALIHFGLARGPERNIAAFNRAEDPLTKNGIISQKRKVVHACLGQLSTNRPPRGSEDAEKGKTIDAVAAVIQNGTHPPAQKKIRGTFGNSGTESMMPRNQDLSDEMKHKVANYFSFSQNLAGLSVALLNNTGAKTIEVSTVSLGGYAWLCYYIKLYAGGMFDGFMVEGFSRAMEGYKSRGVVYSIWIKTISAMARGGDMQDVVKHLWGDVEYDALPLVAIPAVACNILYRSVNIGCFVILTVLAADLDVPHISWKSLNKFFAATAPPAEDDPDVMYKEEFVTLKNFVIRCLDSNRFCPNDDGPFGLHENVSCYITNDGVDNTMLPMHKTSLMRIAVSKDKDDGEDITTKVAQRIDSKEGRRLVTVCQMGPGFHPYKYALIKLMNEFKPDFRGLCPREMFFSDKHFRVLGIQHSASGLSNYDDPDPMPFARQFNFKAGPNDIRSHAIGLNLWSALAVVSLMGGTELHSSLTKTFSNSLMETILAYSPSGFTPGGISPGFDYDPLTTKPIKFYFTAENRPNHFWRPESAAFVHTGSLTLAPSIGRFLPEDCFSLPLPDIAKTLHCDIMEVPGNAFTVRFCLTCTRVRALNTTVYFPGHADPGARRLVLLPHPPFLGRGLRGDGYPQQGGHCGHHALRQGSRPERHVSARHVRVGRFPPQGKHGDNPADQEAGGVCGSRRTGRDCAEDSRMPDFVSRARRPVQPEHLFVPGAHIEGYGCNRDLFPRGSHGGAGTCRGGALPRYGCHPRRPLHHPDGCGQGFVHSTVRSEHCPACRGEALCRCRVSAHEREGTTRRMFELRHVCRESVGCAAGLGVQRGRRQHCQAPQVRAGRRPSFHSHTLSERRLFKRVLSCESAMMQKALPNCELDDDAQATMDEDMKAVILAKKRNEAYDLEFNLKLKQIALSVAILLVLIACMIWYPSLLLGVMAYSAFQCTREPILVVIFLVSTGLFLASHMPNMKVVWVVTDALYEISRSTTTDLHGT